MLSFRLFVKNLSPLPLNLFQTNEYSQANCLIYLEWTHAFGVDFALHFAGKLHIIYVQFLQQFLIKSCPNKKELKINKIIVILFNLNSRIIMFCQQWSNFIQTFRLKRFRQFLFNIINLYQFDGISFFIFI